MDPMQDKRTDTADTESAYAVLKTGYRPFDCSRQAMRRELLAIVGGAKRSAANPAEIISFAQERSRREKPTGEDGA